MSELKKGWFKPSLTKYDTCPRCGDIIDIFNYVQSKDICKRCYGTKKYYSRGLNYGYKIRTRSKS